MARWNVKTKGTAAKPTAVNKAGGAAYKIDEVDELIGLVWTSFCADRFYAKWSATLPHLKALIEKYPQIAAYAALVARKHFGLRSISHVVAAYVAHFSSGEEWLRPFLYAVVHRPDDITEILAVRSQLGLPKAVPHSMRRAFASRLEEYNEYQLAKYRGDDKAFCMKDAIFLCHPKHTVATTALVGGTLKNSETWEAMGNTEATWLTLLREGKLGYLALLRNLRNMLAYNNAELNDLVAKGLVNAEAINRAMIMPHQFVRAEEALSESGGYIPKRIMDALVEATELSVDNLPKWDGTTVIGLDGSGSMRPGMFGNVKGKDAWTTARTFAAALVKRCDNPVLIAFTTQAWHLSMGTMPTLLGQARLNEKVPIGGTNMAAVFDLCSAQRIKADRVILLTDEQSWIGGTGFQAFQKWRGVMGINPVVHSVDLESYGTCQFPKSSKVNLVFGWNSALFNVLKELERKEIGSLSEYCMRAGELVMTNAMAYREKRLASQLGEEEIDV